MKITNKTCYTLRSLKKFFMSGLLEYGISREECKRYCIRVVYTKNNHDYDGKRITSNVSGYAFYDSHSICMRLPPPIEGKLPKLERCAQVFMHEIWHTRGLHHRDMVDSNTIQCNFWKNRTVEAHVEKESAKKPSKVEQRAARANRKVQELTKRIDRYQKLLKKWQKKVAYYEKKVSSEGFTFSEAEAIACDRE